MADEHKELYMKGIHDAFIMEIPVVCSEAYSDTEPVVRAARSRGHTTGTTMTLDKGWNFEIRAHRQMAIELVKKEKPYFLVIAFPCGPWSPLQNLSSLPAAVAIRQEKAMPLVTFACRLARLQMDAGRHFVMENPLGSRAWTTPPLLSLRRDLRTREVSVDMCRFDLRGPLGLRHKKPTRILTSSQSVRSALLGCRCTGKHRHEPTMGGAAVTTAAGHYTRKFAEKLVVAFEAEFDFEAAMATREVKVSECFEVVGGHSAVDFYHEVLAEDVGEFDDDSDADLGEPFKGEITSAVRAAVRRVHEATGHRPPRRLARALLLSGAPPAAVQAARELRCDVCQERKAPKSRRVAGLPPPRTVGEQIHVDLLMVDDALGNVYVVAHATDAVSRYQLARVIPDRSTASVIAFLSEMWLPMLGTPRTIVADQGREFISEEMQVWCSSHSIMLWHSAVQAPWQNGVAERSGGILKSLIAACVVDQTVIGHASMCQVVGEACAAYNADPNSEGVSPMQAATGRQPSNQGSVLNNFAGRLAEHGLIDSEPNLLQRVALRESARVAMVRLRYSQSIRKAELARSREPTVTAPPLPGDTVYFWRATKPNSRRGDPNLSTSSRRRRLELKRWHGPAILLCLEGGLGGGTPVNAFLSFKGQVTKCALEHVRAASSLEQLAANSWEEAIRELTDRLRPAPAVEVSRELDSIPEGVNEPETIEDETVDIGAAPNSSQATTDARDSVLLTAAPGTPVGHLFETPAGPLLESPGLLDRPVLQRALSRVRGEPLEADLRLRALQRGQPADFAAELRATMQRSALERGLKRQSESEPGGGDSVERSRRSSFAVSEPPTILRRTLSEAPQLPQHSPEPAGALHLARGSSTVPSGDALAEAQQLPQHSPEPAGASGESSTPGQERSVLAVNRSLEGLTLSHEDLSHMVLNVETLHPLLQVQAQAELDRQRPLECFGAEADHGTWDGR